MSSSAIRDSSDLASQVTGECKQGCKHGPIIGTQIFEHASPDRTVSVIPSDAG